jgi:hypothetical protein
MRHLANLVPELLQEQRTVNPLIAPARYNFLYSSQGRPCGRPPPAAVLGRHDTTAAQGTDLSGGPTR